MMAEAFLRSLSPYWREALLLWFGAIILLAVIHAVLAWMGRERPGQFAQALGTLPTLVMIGLPPLAGLVAGLHLMREYREAEAFVVFLFAPLVAVLAGEKLKRLLVWLLTAGGRSAGRSAAPPIVVKQGKGPLINGRPIEPS
ncbi:hypothetical protein [Erythrobacter sp. SD-21]|uniref:hypothetical protein n=1 Tax=Erythrobacter sp. SD-21 TaxID=161528 RepID=UPI000153FE2C|nr:hypothetical protein [Erythrobacter sp. SD-21]EDL49192.1 hypothetical protein ED21_20969 [Erythrobacter sp. SD-21]